MTHHRGSGGEFVKLPHTVLDELGPRLGMTAAIQYYCWLRRHVNREPGHPLRGYAWPSHRYTCAHFGCSHHTLARLEEALVEVGLIEIHRAGDMVAHGLVAAEDMARVLRNPSNSFLFRVRDPGQKPAGLAADMAARPEARAAARDAAKAAARLAAEAAAEKDVPEKQKPEKDRPEKDRSARASSLSVLSEETTEESRPRGLRTFENGMIPAAAWRLLLEMLRPERQDQSMLLSVTPLGFREGILYVEATSTFTAEYVETRLSDRLNRYARELGLAGVKVVKARRLERDVECGED